MRKVVWKVVAIVASAVMFVLALPPADVYPLGFFCFVPVLFAVQGKGFGWGFFSGIAVLMLSAFLASTGLFYEPSLVGASPEWLFAGFALFGLVVGGVCAIAGETRKAGRWFPFVLAAVAVLLEAVLLVYLPAHLALTQYRCFPAMKVASFAGIWGVSYFAWLMNIWFVVAARSVHRPALLVIGALLGLYVGLSTFAGRIQPGGLQIGVVQTESHNGEELAALNAEATAQGADIVVWPELSGQTMARIDISQLSEIASRDGQAPFATTFNEAGERLPYNVASVFSVAGESDRYRKRKPFAGEVNIHAAGTEAVAVEIDGVRYGLNICFDSCFPAVMLDTASLGVDAILLPTLDPIAPYGTIQAMHSAYTPFRAAELGVPIARADITAYSMVVDGRGVIVAEAGAGTTEVNVGTVEVGERWTLYKKWGDWFLYLCGLIAVAGVLVDRRKTVRRPVDSE